MSRRIGGGISGSDGRAGERGGARVDTNALFIMYSLDNFRHVLQAPKQSDTL